MEHNIKFTQAKCSDVFTKASFGKQDCSAVDKFFYGVTNRDSIQNSLVRLYAGNFCCPTYTRGVIGNKVGNLIKETMFMYAYVYDITSKSKLNKYAYMN